MGCWKPVSGNGVAPSQPVPATSEIAVLSQPQVVTVTEGDGVDADAPCACKSAWLVVALLIVLLLTAPRGRRRQ